ncbi:hypothetical protein WH96_20265, partial [Kiloniella spongiae]
EVKKEFTGPGLPKDASFSYSVDTFQGDGKINVANCNNKSEYYWKILKHGEGWMQMANRATSQCLHFKENSSLPGQAIAEWASCTGSANQVYRVADKTTPEYYASNIALKNDSESACFSDPDANGKITMVDCTKGAKYNYVIDIRGYIKFINAKSGNCIQPENYQNGAFLIEKPCTQLDYQWWNPTTVPGGWRIQNAQTNTCTHAPGLGQTAVTETCKDWAQSVIAPVIDPYSGITYTNDASLLLSPAIPETTADVGICLAHVTSAGNTQVTGTLGNDRKCYFNFKGKDLSVPAGGKNTTVSVLDGTIWQAHTMGEKIPEYAVPGGFLDAGAKSKATYICRAKVNYGSTKFGWVAEENSGNNLCNYQLMHNSEDAHGYTRPAQDFEVLVRRADKAYLLHLSDLKPGGSSAGQDPIIKTRANQKSLYEGERNTKAIELGPQAQNGSPLSGYVPDGDNGPKITNTGNIVTIKGRVRGGSRGAIWRIPENLAPENTILFRVKTSFGNVIIGIKRDGTIVPIEEFWRGNMWIDFAGVEFSTSSVALAVKGTGPSPMDSEGSGWQTSGKYASPRAAKVGSHVVVNGVVTGHNGNFEMTRGAVIASLPDGMRPSKQLQFNVPMQKIGESITSGIVNVYPDGRIALEGRDYDVQNKIFVSLSGISFEATANSFTRADEYGPLLNGWKPDQEHNGGYAFSIENDIVTFSGGVIAGGRGDFWKMSTNAAPPERLVFTAKTSEDIVRLDILPNGMVSANNYFFDFNWLSLEGIVYSRRKPNALPFENGWEQVDGYAAPGVVKVGKQIVVTGVVARSAQQNNQDYNPFGVNPSETRLVARLPEGMHPAKTLRFDTLNTNVKSNNPGTIRVEIYTDGRIEVPGNIEISDVKSISLSGITFNVQ